MAGFDRFLAVDWSGAMGERQRGIQVAHTDYDNDPAILRLPDAKNWGRVVVKNLITKMARSNRRTLIGIDFCFSLPWPNEGPQPEGGGRLSNVEQLWELVDLASASEPHFYAGPVVRNLDSPFAPYILCDRYRGEQFRFDRFRETEQQLSPKPASVFHCMGAKQVGPGSFAGMRMLHSLRRLKDSRVAIWPFDPIDNASVVLCELYPSLWYQMAGVSRAYDAQSLKQVTDFYEVDNPPILQSQDEADAVVSAAALRYISTDPEFFTKPQALQICKKEGWIFGSKPH